MKRLFNFFRDIYDYFFYRISIQERRFKSDYDILRIKFIADNHTSLVDIAANELTFKHKHPKEDGTDKENGNKSDEEKRKANYAELCRNVVNMLHSSNRYGKRLDTDSKFKLLNIAKREQIWIYNNFECDTRIKQILVESSKLDAWRKEAVLQLLSNYKDIAKDQPYEPVRTSLYEAAYIRDVHFDNLYYKSKIAKKTIQLLNRVLVALLLTILACSAVLEFGFNKPREFLLGQFSSLWLVVLFGLLGAAFSTLLNLYKGDNLKNTIIKQIDTDKLTTARLVIGACAGLIVYLILNSGLITIKGFNEGANGKIPLPLELPLLSLVFVAGFTERLVLNFIDKLSAQAQKSGSDSTSEITQSSILGNKNGKQTKDEESQGLKNVANVLANKGNDDKANEN